MKNSAVKFAILFSASLILVGISVFNSDSGLVWEIQEIGSELVSAMTGSLERVVPSLVPGSPV